MIEFFRTTRGRVLTAGALTALLIVLGVAYRLPITFMPALAIPIWVSLLAGREDSFSFRPQRRMRVASAVGVGFFLLTFGLGVFVFAAPVLAGLIAGLVGVVAVFGVTGAGWWRGSRER